MNILPINESPLLSELHTSAFPLSILEAQKSFSNVWLLNKIIPISFEKKFNNVLTYDFHYFWYWNCFKINLIYCLKKKCLSYIKKQLSLGYYVFISVVNEKFIPERYAFQNVDYMHDLLIYGYSESKQSFITIAYNENAQYKPQWIFEEDIYKSVLNSTTPFFKCFALKPKKEYDFEFVNYKKVKKDLFNYFNPKKHNKGYLSYKLLIDDCYPKKKYDYAIDLRSFRMMRDRAKLFYLLKNELNINEEHFLKENIRISKLVLNLAIKYNITKDLSLISKIHSLIKDYSNNEFIILGSLKKGV